MVGSAQTGTLVYACEEEARTGWIRLLGESSGASRPDASGPSDTAEGWMLVSGASLGLGLLLRRVVDPPWGPLLRAAEGSAAN